MNISLKQRVILVTGGGGGIGAALCKRLAASGGRVALHCHRSFESARQLAETVDGEVEVFVQDLSQSHEVRALYSEVLKKMGGIDVLINNAAVSLPNPLTQIDDTDWLNKWTATMDLNVKAPAMLSRLVLQHFLQKKRGHVINVTSRAAHRGDTALYFDYAVSKSALQSMAKTIARNYGKQGIVAFNLAPGFVQTQMAQEFIETYGIDHVLSDLALDTLTQPEDVAALVLLMCSGMMDHATGATFDMNAGSYIR